MADHERENIEKESFKMGFVCLQNGFVRNPQGKLQSNFLLSKMLQEYILD